MNGASGRTCIVTGVTGQDGFYSARRLLRKGARVTGVSRQTLENAGPHVQLLARHPDFHFISMPEYTKTRVRELISDVKPDRIIHGAGFRDIPSHESEVAQCYFTNCDLADMLLTAITDLAPRARFLFISSAEIFGKTYGAILDENTQRSPQNDYGISKVQGMQRVEHFRTARNTFAVSAICFNHDSFLSPESHLVRLVPRKLLRFTRDKDRVLKFYNTDMRRDWSHAKDFAAAFDLMLENSTPTDFVVASGRSTTLKEYIDLTCDLLGIESREFLAFESRDDEDTYDRIASADRIKQQLGWSPQITVKRLCRQMIRCSRQ
jgi:GDPmannose 4,6-dehydratase